LSVTVYILNRNYASFLSRAIDSVLAQTHKDLEIILIDDFSTDSSREIIESYRNHKKIKIIFNKENLGLIKSANIALKLSKKDYIVRLDSDDYFYNNAIKDLYEVAIKDKNIGLVYGNYNLIDTNNKILRRRIRLCLKDEVKIIGHPCHGACTLFNVKALNEIGGYSEKFDRQDGVYAFYSILIKGWKINNIKKVIFAYTQHSKSLSRNKRILYKSRSKILNEIGNNSRKEIKSTLIISIADIENLIISYKTKKNFFKYLNNELAYYGKKKFISNIVIIVNDKKLLDYLDGLNKVKMCEISQDFDRLKLKNNLFLKLKHVLNKLNLCNEEIYFIRNLEFPNLALYNLDSGYNLLRLLEEFKTLITIKKIDNQLLKIKDGFLAFEQDDLLEMHEREEKYSNNGGLLAIRNEVLFNNKKDSLFKQPIFGLDIDEISSIHINSSLQDYIFNQKL